MNINSSIKRKKANYDNNDELSKTDKIKICMIYSCKLKSAQHNLRLFILDTF